MEPRLGTSYETVIALVEADGDASFLNTLSMRSTWLSLGDAWSISSSRFAQLALSSGRCH